MLDKLKKYAEEQAEYHDKEYRMADERLDEEYHLGQRDAYAAIVSIIKRGLS